MEQDTLTRDSEATAAAERTDSGNQTPAQLRHKLDEQSKRIAALALEREQSMQLVEELKTELALVSAERDQLRKSLTAIDAMQTETVTLGDSALEELADSLSGPTPSIDELMSTFSGADSGARPSHATRRVDGVGDSGEFPEMISPEAIVLGSSRDKSRNRGERFLLTIAPNSRKRCPLDQELMTIGRSDSADIQIDGDFVSRIHARVLRIGMDSIIEDAGSKNGTRINGDPVSRHVLKHGDFVQIGSVGFRYVDAAIGPDDPD